MVPVSMDLILGCQHQRYDQQIHFGPDFSYPGKVGAIYRTRYVQTLLG